MSSPLLKKIYFCALLPIALIIIVAEAVWEACRTFISTLYNNIMILWSHTQRSLFRDSYIKKLPIEDFWNEV
jgi:hypothetical protein